MGGILIGLVLVAIIATVVAVLVARGPFRRVGVDESLVPATVAVTSRIRLRNTVAVVAAVIVAVLLLGYGGAVPSDLGRIVLIAPVLTVATGILFFSIVPAFRESSPRRSADLAPRTALTFGTRRSYAVAAALVGGLVTAIVVLGLLASPDGRSVSRAGENFGMTASPYPGFYYGTPTLAAVALLVGVVVLAIARIARAPRPGDPGLREADAALRQLAIVVVLRATAAGAAATLAAMLIGAGITTSSISRGMATGDPAGDAPSDALLQALGIGTSIVGMGLAVLAVVLSVAAITNALRAPLALSSVTAS